MASSVGPDVTTLNEHDAEEYRRELLHAMHNPGIEFDLWGKEGERDEELYRAKLMEVNAHLATFPQY